MGHVEEVLLAWDHDLEIAVVGMVVVEDPPDFATKAVTRCSAPAHLPTRHPSQSPPMVNAVLIYVSHAWDRVVVRVVVNMGFVGIPMRTVAVKIVSPGLANAMLNEMLVGIVSMIGRS